MIVKSSYMLALNSIESKQPERFQDTVDEYYSFIAGISRKQFSKDAVRMYENASQYLKTRNIDVIKE